MNNLKIRQTCLTESNYGWANSVMERICEKRKADGLHGLAIQWGLIGQVGIAHGLFNGKDDKTLLGTTFQSIESCLEILDKALLQTHSAVVSSSMIADKEISNGERGGLMQRLQKIFGIADIHAIDPQRNLNELGMDSIVAVELKQTLEREYDVSIKKQHLAVLTVGDLRAIGEGTFDVQTLRNTPVGPNSEEIYVPFQLHYTTLVQLKSHSRNCQVFMVHGAEGSSASLKPLATKLHANVHAFQMTGKLEWNSLMDLAANYVKEMKEKQLTGPYTILGYSAGCTIAYEMAQLLASKGELVQDLVFLDGPPSYGHMEVGESYVIELLEAMSFLKNISQDRLEAFKNNLNVEKNDIIPKSFELIISGITVGPAQAQVYKKLYTEFGKHVPQGTYDGQVHVLQAAESASEYSPVNSTELFCTGLVTRHEVAGNHRTFLTETFVDESARIINSLLTKACA